jgi:poly [ADP-ribose] polymerase 7/11/12/13
MFLARVLTGHVINGHSAFVKPPVIPGSPTYHSCVDNVENPNIYVIFELGQAYPEYLLEF